MSDLFKELIRIADTIDNKKDADLIRQAAVKCIPEQKAIYDETTKIHNYGFVRSTTY